MKRNLFWKFLLVLFVVGWSLWELYPPTSRDLITVFEERAINRDTNFNAIVQQARAMEKQYPERTFQNLADAVGTNQIARYFPQITVEPGPVDASRQVLQELQRQAAGQIKLGLDLRGGTSFLVGLDTNNLADAQATDRVLAQAVEVLRKRVDRFGVSEPLIQPAGENRILIQLPGLTDAEKESARTQIQRAAFLEFRIVHAKSDELLQKGLGAPGYEVLRVTREENGQEFVTPYLVKKKPEHGLTGTYVSRAYVSPHPVTGQPEIVLNFNSEGAELFAAVTKENVGRLLAIVLDGELYSAPVIRVPILDGNASISGDFTVEEAIELANVLENPLEAPVDIQEEYSVEPSLGKDSIQAGVRASLIGMIAVAGFMLVYYLLAGLVANVALLLNIIILLGVMCSVDTTLTLPGIAGIVLTIGMAVDANVLIFERIREEIANGKSLRGAITAGYDKAFSTIFDSNITTLIASTILIFLGTGPVKGFGVTLTIGVAASMFTALVVTRLAFDWLVQVGWMKSLPMLRLVGKTQIDFLRYAKPAFIASWILVIASVGYGISRGNDVLGVDFAGGDRLTFAFEQRVEVEEIRKVTQGLDVGDAMIQYQRDGSGASLLQVTSEFGSGEKVEAALKAAFPEAGFRVIETLNVGPSVGREILRAALIAMLLALFGILIYVALRYEFSFALGAVVAVLHDVFMTMGIFCLAGGEFSAPMVAAILTIIGFSINDTIVIFDRIREDLKLGLRGTFREIINHALNQTLSRTLITSGTVLLATGSLYIFGGPVINDFAFTFLVGIVVGTYSTIYIASAFVLWWHKGERPKIGAQTIMESAAAPARA